MIDSPEYHRSYYQRTAPRRRLLARERMKHTRQLQWAQWLLEKLRAEWRTERMEESAQTWLINTSAACGRQILRATSTCSSNTNKYERGNTSRKHFGSNPSRAAVASIHLTSG